MKLLELASFVVATGFLAPSCATFPNHRLPEVAANPVQASKKVSLSYKLTCGSEMIKRVRQEFPTVAKQQIESSMVSAANRSGRFSSVSQGKSGKVNVEIDLLNHGDGVSAMVSGFISGFTFLAVPGFATDNYRLTATATDGGKKRQYVLDDGATTVFWLPLIVATPFSNPVTVVPKLHENMYLNLFQKMEADGLLPKSGN